jgi:hypothetical protein
MTECKQIQEMLPAFSEGMLSPDEKGLLLEHLAKCRHCSAALEELKKTVQLVQGLDEVEPPPWFTLEIMSRVREEAEQKKRGLFARLFYPLHVKVPIQALASVLIVVMALYVYRSVDPQMKVAQAPSEVARQDLALPKNETHQQYDKAGAGAPSPEKKSVPDERRDKAADRIAAVPRTEAPKAVEKEEAPPQASLAAESARADKREAVADRQPQEMRAAAPSPGQKEAPHVQAQAQKAPSPVLAQREAESTVLTGAQGKMKEARDSAVPQAAREANQLMAKKVESPDFTLRVSDVAATAAEIKSLLSQLGARGIAAESLNSATVITAELTGQNVEELFRKLRGLGQVEEKGSHPAATDGLIAIRIEVFGKP